MFNGEYHKSIENQKYVLFIPYSEISCRSVIIKVYSPLIPLHNILCRLYFAAKFPPIDIAFALSATGISANKTFSLMKDTVQRIVDTHGTGSLRYSVIVFSDSANIIIRFSEKYSSLDQLKTSIEALPLSTGGSSLTEALAAAKNAFQDSGVRKDSTHVLVVITDKRSGESEDDIEKAAKPLEESGIVVVPVGIGGQVNDKELVVITSNKDNVILVDEDEDPDNLMEMIMAKINGMALHNLVNLTYMFFNLIFRSTLLEISQLGLTPLPQHIEGTPVDFCVKLSE